QRTKGKTWFWESAGSVVLDTGLTSRELTLLLSDGRELVPETADGQFIADAYGWQTEGTGLALFYGLYFLARFPDANGAWLGTPEVRRKWPPLPAGFTQEVSLGPLPEDVRVRLRVLSPEAARTATRSADGRTLLLGDRFGSRIVLHEPAGATFTADASAVLL